MQDSQYVQLTVLPLVTTFVNPESLQPPPEGRKMAGGGGTPPPLAIKFGTPASSNGQDTKKHARPKPTSSLGKRHRAHALNDESESEDDDEARSTGGRHEAITTYGPDGASSDDRRSSRHRRRSDSPGGGRLSGRDSRSDRKSHRGDGRSAHQNGSLKEVDPADQDKPVKWGLTINSKPRQKKEEDRPARNQDDKDPEAQPKTADEEAMEALMAKPGDRKRRRNDTSGDPDRDPVPEDYRSVPVEDFGATLLRGFGWDGKMRGKVKEVTKHANLTGLGAKDLKGAEDLGAWSQKSNKESGSGRPRPSRLDDYRREEEKKRQRRQDKHGDSYRHEKEREKGRDRDRERERDRDRR